MELGLKDRVVIVTGAASGIGDYSTLVDHSFRLS